MPRNSSSPALRRVLSAVSALAIVAFSFSWGLASASADSVYSVTGTIADTTTTGIGSLQLLLMDSTNTLVATTTTDANGGYSFLGVADGTYTIQTTESAGYVPLHSTVTVADADTVLNVTDPRIGSIAGELTSGGHPVSGAHVKAIDSGTNAEFDASGATDASGNFTITLPATTGGYTFYFTDSSGSRLPISSYDFGGASVAASSACVLTAGTSNLSPLVAGNPVSLNVVATTDVTACSTATPSPSAKAPRPNTSLAQTGSVTAVPPTPTPSATTTDSSKTTDTSAPATTGIKPLFTPTASTAPMPAWGWALVVVAMLAMFGGVGFTVVRHR